MKRYGRPHVMRGDGEGTAFYLGDERGAPYISIHLGFSGWCSAPLWMPGGWEFFCPTLSTGRLFMHSGRTWSRRVLLPAHAVRAWRWATSATYRRGMREMPS